ncbi:MAG: sugar ABC transporter ATP-binding protein, partial [Chitinivibrionales bacterium]|nr:sugar ABC transporter ATP-binding protein [Chitinivibrionales bacterium]
RDGKMVSVSPVKGLTVRQIAAAMVGRSVDVQSGQISAPAPGRNGAPLFSVEHLWVDMPGETVRDVNLSIDEGEIVGVGGLAGQGKLGIANGIMGLYPSGGTMLLRGKPVPLNAPATVLARGMAFVSEDRRGVGLLLGEGIDWNIAFAAMQTRGACLKPLLGGLLQWRSDSAMEELARHYITMLDIKCMSHKQKAGTLSGGNQQKVCLAKAFALKPDILFVSEPTRGIDIGAKRLVLDTLKRYNQEYGTTIVMISSELEELRSICSRIAIVGEGRISGVLPSHTPIEDFGLLMSGVPLEKTETLVSVTPSQQRDGNG